MNKFLITILILTTALVTSGCLENVTKELAVTEGQEITADKNGISIGMIEFADDKLAAVRTDFEEEKNIWRQDPLLAAITESRDYGFLAEDNFELSYSAVNGENSQAEVLVEHGGNSYKIFLTQPVGTGTNKPWLIQSISHN
ncbi:MAG: hypothetical protein ABIE68_03375 [bacterium]